MSSLRCAGEESRKKCSSTWKLLLRRWARTSWFWRLGSTRKRRSAFTFEPDSGRSTVGRVCDRADQRLLRKAALARPPVWRRPEHQHAQVFFDAVESVLDSGRHEDKASGLDRPVLIADPNRTAPADDVVNLVFGVRLLAIGRVPRPHGQTNAQLLRSEKVDVAMNFGITRLGIEFGNLECFHSTSQ